MVGRAVLCPPLARWAVCKDRRARSDAPHLQNWLFLTISAQIVVNQRVCWQTGPPGGIKHDLLFASRRGLFASKGRLFARRRRLSASRGPLFASRRGLFASKGRLFARKRRLFASGRELSANRRPLCASERGLSASRRRLCASGRRVQGHFHKNLNPEPQLP